MDQNPDVIRQNIEETRSSLTEKLETLEHEVLGTVRDATQAVSCTVENVKETVASTVENVKEKVQETVDSVKQTFDLRRQVARHPWAMVGGSVAAGYVIGSLLPENSTKSFNSLSSSSAVNYSSQPQPVASNFSRPAARGGLWSSLLDALGPEMEKVKGMAIGMTMGLVRDMVKSRIPEAMTRDFDELVNNVTVKLGGQPVHGPVLESCGCGPESSCHESAAATTSL